MDTKELTALTQGIASALGNEWEVPLNDNNWTCKITHKLSQKVLYVSGDGYNKPTKVNISGSLHVGECGRYVEVYQTAKDGSGWRKQTVPTISITIARGYDVIAKEINRRLLPEYDRILTLALTQVQKDKEYKDARQANIEALAEAAGVKSPDGKDNLYVHFGEVYGTVEVYKDSANVKLNSLTLAQTRRLLQLLKEGEL